MASSFSSPKQLWEHLREQQEPFMLNIYILERIESNHSKRGCKCYMNKGKFYTKNILKLMLCKFICHKCSQQDFNCHKVQKQNLVSKITGELWRIGRTKRCSDIGCSVAYHDLSIRGTSSSLNNKHSGFIEKEVATDMNKKQRKSDEKKQLKPRSFSDEAPKSSISRSRFHFSAKGEEDDESSSSTILTENAVQDSINSAFLSETEKLDHAEFMESNGKYRTSSSGFMKLSENKGILQNSEQPFDCTNKGTEMHERKTIYGKCTIGSHGLEEVAKYCSWINQKPTHNLNFDVSNVIEDWNDMEKSVKRTIMKEIGDIIMEKMIQEVIDFIFV